MGKLQATSPVGNENREYWKVMRLILALLPMKDWCYCWNYPYDCLELVGNRIANDWRLKTVHGLYVTMPTIRDISPTGPRPKPLKHLYTINLFAERFQLQRANLPATKSPMRFACNLYKLSGTCLGHHHPGIPPPPAAYFAYCWAQMLKYAFLYPVTWYCP